MLNKRINVNYTIFCYTLDILTSFYSFQSIFDPNSKKNYPKSIQKIVFVNQKLVL